MKTRAELIEPHAEHFLPKGAQGIIDGYIYTGVYACALLIVDDQIKPCPVCKLKVIDYLDADKNTQL